MRDGGAGRRELFGERRAFSTGTIGSIAPESIRTGLPARSAARRAAKGTIGRISTAPARTSGRWSSVAAAMLAPFEKPSARGAARP